MIDPFESEHPAFWTSHGPVTHEMLHARADALLAHMPSSRFAVNYCERRDRFALALLATWQRGQTALFPADRAAHTFALLRDEHPDVYALADDAMPFDAGRLVRVDEAAPDATACGVPQTKPATLARSHPAVKVYTSGSTGKPSVNEKSWDMLVAGGKAIPKMLRLDGVRPTTAVATVPSQHMYGFEITIMNVLQGGLSAHVERPVFPADIARCLDEVPEPRVLVTTPVHLRALVESATRFGEIDRVVSATAPLSPALAAAAERKLKAPVWEIYGFTEAGSVANRQTVASDEWTLREDFVAREEAGRQFLEWPAFGRKIPFPDVVEIVDSHRIRLRGRAQDIVNIAGKRASLSGLSAHLLEVDGVQDAVFWLPAEDVGMGVVSRLVAFVVAPGLSEAEIRSALNRRLDAAFVPRSIVFVQSLPRNATGKLTEGALKAFAARYTGGDGDT